MHTINGNKYPMELNLLHISELGRKVYISVFLNVNDIQTEESSILDEFSKLAPGKGTKTDTSKNYKVSHYKGSFAVISTVTNPFCDSCNRLRLTANGQLKNCLFSSEENDLLTQLREGKSIEGVIQKSVLMKKKIRNGLTTNESFSNKKKHSENRSMIAIGG